MDCSRARSQDPVEWMEKCPDFSRPLAEQLHDWILTWEPDLQESIKWNMLCYTGRKLVCGLSACQKHLGITFFRGVELPDPAGLFTPAENNTSTLTIRLHTLEGFRMNAFRAVLHAAVALDTDPEAPPVPRVRRKPYPVPTFFKELLKQPRHRRAAANFESLAPSCQREYLVWISTAKRPETRARRTAETLAALKAGLKWDRRKQAGPSHGYGVTGRAGGRAPGRRVVPGD